MNLEKAVAISAVRWKTTPSKLREMAARLEQTPSYPGEIIYLSVEDTGSRSIIIEYTPDFLEKASTLFSMTDIEIQTPTHLHPDVQ